MSLGAKGFLRVSNISQKVAKAEYALQNFYSAQEKRLKDIQHQNQSSLSDSIIMSNHCNPHSYGQNPITFNRQCISAILNPDLAKAKIYNQDVIKRTEYYLSKLGYPLGAYSEDVGYISVMKNVAKFLEKRDGAVVDHNNIFLTDGVTSGMNMVLRVLVESPNDAFMIPAPQSPLYGALAAVHNAQSVPYYLNEDKGWEVDIDELQRIYDKNKEKGVKVKGIFVCNPGNPTGKVMSKEAIQKIVDFAHRNKVIILADEVLQETIYKDELSFVSLKKIVSENPDKPVDLFSFYSASNALHGEGGYRAGFFEVFNLDPEVYDQLKKLKTMYVCSNTVGQIMVDLMVNPPNRETNSAEVVEEYEKEKKQIINSLKSKGNILGDCLNSMKNVTCNRIEGGIYVFPRLHLTEKAIQKAKTQNMEPDNFYSSEAFENTGIVLEPGNIFMQVPGTYHYRFSSLSQSEEGLKKKMEELYNFNEKFQAKYE